MHEGWRAWCKPLPERQEDSVATSTSGRFRSPCPPAEVEPPPPLSGLSPVRGKPLIGRVDGGQLSSDAGVLALREVERRLGIAERLAARIDDPRPAQRVRHEVGDVLRFRVPMIAAGYEDADDADSLRHDPAFEPALGRLPNDAALRSQPTLSRLENLPGPRSLPRMGRAMHGRAPLRQLPAGAAAHRARHRRHLHTAHGGRQLRLFDADYDE